MNKELSLPFPFAIDEQDEHLCTAEDSSEADNTPWVKTALFRDDYLMLVYENPVKGKTLSRLKELLTLACDQAASDKSRAHAYLHIGRAVCERAKDIYSLTEHDTEVASKCFKKALELGDIEAATDLALLQLAEFGYTINVEGDDKGLPVIYDHTTETPVETSTRLVHACAAWYRGIQIAIKDSDALDSYSTSALNAARLCILAFMTLAPRFSGRGTRLFGALHMPDPGESMTWLRPLWAKVEHASLPHYRESAQARRDFKTQFQTACLMLEEYKPKRLGENLFENVDNNSSEKQGASTRNTSQGTTDAHRTEGSTHRVINTEIPKSTDRGDNQYLQRYAELQKPVAMTGLPDIARLRQIEQQLHSEFPWAQKAVETVIGELMARKQYGVLTLGFAPLLLVGLPASGKSYFARRLGELLQIPNTVINMAGMTDVKVLKGLARGWSGNRPSRIVEFILQTRTANPLFILDEIDKADSHHGSGGNPKEALLDLLEPGNAKRYTDQFLMAECDLSHCLYIATSNSLKRLPEPLLSRLRIVFFPAPGAEHTPVIVKGTLRDLERSWQLPEGALTLTAAQTNLLTGLGTRDIRRAIVDLLGNASHQQKYVLH